MQNFRSYLLPVVLIVATAFVLAVPPTGATDISGAISSTLTITDNSQLVGNVTCTVTDAPCIKFGASNITLNLNGFIVTADPVFVCQLSAASGIDTNGQSGVKIKGPGLVRRFLGNGIAINGGANNNVDGVAVSTSPCATGIALLNTSDNDVEGNTVVVLPALARLSTGIRIAANGSGSSNNNRVRNNECSGHATGVRLLGVSGGVLTGNLIEENNMLGNDAGIEIGSGATGNLVRRNAALDNGSLAAGLVDILDNNAAGANTYQGNLCDVSTGTGAAGVCPNVPSFAGHRNVQ